MALESGPEFVPKFQNAKNGLGVLCTNHANCGMCDES